MLVFRGVEHSDAVLQELYLLVVGDVPHDLDVLPDFECFGERAELLVVLDVLVDSGVIPAGDDEVVVGPVLELREGVQS